MELQAWRSKQWSSTSNRSEVYLLRSGCPRSSSKLSDALELDRPLSALVAPRAALAMDTTSSNSPCSDV